ncbi:MAG TPA: UDP-N-acetylmuramoyl-L-alanine--D-glutamate ligase [Elusimicrobiales bacterium]|nr:UDP-N-acetylmuramoyl-L-alanine--D-glutamate ligase [Elusimicrobiales bacterium]
MSFNPGNFKKGAKTCVLGFGRSGIACANLLVEAGFQVLLSELRPLPSDAAAKGGLNGAVKLESGGHGKEVLSADFVVKSPGIFPASDILKSIKKAGIPVFSELEVAIAFCPKCQLFAVTGTNGKTTTATLLYQILKSAAPSGCGVWLAGNVGKPLAAMVKDIKEGDMVALEVSSYQLEDSSGFSPDFASLLNITPDHIDHHGGMEQYLAAKKKIFSGQHPDAYCVFNAGDALSVGLAANCPSKKLYFSSAAEPASAQARYGGGRLVFRFEKIDCALEPPSLPGVHNLENAMCAGLMALAAGAAPDAVARAFKSFRGVEHRLEEAGVVSGVRCINDSKATNVDSTVIALRALRSGKKNIWLILGGQDKGVPYAPLVPLIKESVIKMLLIGEAAGKIEAELGAAAPCARVETIKNALDRCLLEAQPGDILLLSPACASFDQFRDFEHRGASFKELVAARSVLSAR